jgi:hypothetical protein
MRVLALTILAAGALLARTPSHAQTYAPGYPVCLHVYGQVTYYECGYTSLPQCNASASGRAAQCVVNPYYASARMETPPVRHYRRYYRAY